TDDEHQVGDLVDHPAHGRGVFQFALAVQATQAEPAHGGAMRLLAADRALDEPDLECFLFRHGNSVAATQLKSSSTVLRRLAAASPAVVERRSASSVARTML